MDVREYIVDRLNVYFLRFGFEFKDPVLHLPINRAFRFIKWSVMRSYQAPVPYNRFG